MRGREKSRRMNEKKRHTQRVMISLFLCLFLVTSGAHAGNYKVDYTRAQVAAGEGNVDFAFMNYRSVLQNNPRGKYKVDALFANGEYYFIMNQHKESKMYFNEYLNLSDNLNGKLFALVYRLKLAYIDQDNNLVKKIEKDIITYQQQSFIFKKSKVYRYVSPMNREHKAVYAIDRIQFFVGGKLFAKILL